MVLSPFSRANKSWQQPGEKKGGTLIEGDILFILLVGALMGLIPAMIANNKRHPAGFFVWWIYGALLFIIALVHSLLLKPATAAGPDRAAGAQHTGTRRECPHCKEPMRRDASVCPHCQRDSQAWRFKDGHWWFNKEGTWYWLREPQNEWVEWQQSSPTPLSQEEDA